MTYRQTFWLIFLSSFSLTFTESDKPCERIVNVQPSHNNFWSNLERRKYYNCDDTSKYYVKMYNKETLKAEGNIINKLKEGVWKNYTYDSLRYEVFFYHDKKIRSTTWEDNSIYTNVTINDTLIYSMQYENGKQKSGGFSVNGAGYYGVWEDKDSTKTLKAIGKYFPESICDTISVRDTFPPYLSYDSVTCCQVKDSDWFYFDENNQLIRIEKYNKGKLIK
ncbi:MAG: hypothetical protein ABI723_05005 [Bacteroidia bacterium]